MQWIVLPVSALSLLWGVQLVREIRLARRLRRVGIEVVGHVVRQREVNGRGGRYLVPTLGVTPRTGQPVEGESAGQAPNLEFCDGDAVRVVYDPSRPARFLLAQELTGTSRYWYLAVIGVLLVGMLVLTWQ